MPRVYGFSEEGFRRVQEAARRVLGSPRTGAQRRRQPPVLSGGTCPYRWTFYYHGGGKPSSGSQIWSVTIESDTQDVTVNYNQSGSTLKSHILSQFTGLSSSDVDVIGGPGPEVPLTVEWKGDKPDWPPVVGTNTLNNGGWMSVADN